ncbi:hypothetical protein TSAR_014452 [Trichomalopsis sarcophagae]|uniref:Uncharacterized protein n=1 Tax=Trichomalopsis sarcophagae TaxID=543379 RepID=A0A232F9L7_9HYME|nr:hypothetical protein TSAR_014452 [Trichomalopsis sarcophagae]
MVAAIIKSRKRYMDFNTPERKSCFAQLR